MWSCPNCEALAAELDRVTKERDQERESWAKATDLMMKGEALRDRMMFMAITGKFPPKT